ncbi:Ion channel [Vitreoscilla filiformis]|jgi:voltage-gated potassium channel|uniref:Ion channel n=1 Tax=Vitreoscilla filiformis TaxID=63 RepID=A0A221KE60_VITFI|nr:potassium channel family protein [Vitreoscilla filiformis]ASM77249.1 Ion channel [Vitreoscilla filiformis]
MVSWGLSSASCDNLRAARVERGWRWPTMLVLLGTVPAFYAELLLSAPSMLADAAYLCAAMMVGASLLHVGWYTRHPLRHLLCNPTDIVLVAGLVASAVLPTSHASAWALGVRLAVSFASLLRMVWTMQYLITRGGLIYLLLVAVLVLGACGLGFWWLEPTTPTLADGLWLAFTTAATVGYGDLVPTTPASKIFSVFVVLLGLGVLTLVTAAIATSWVETEERIIEREILHDMRREMATLHHELSLVREELAQLRASLPANEAGSPDIRRNDGGEFV